MRIDREDISKKQEWLRVREDYVRDAFKQIGVKYVAYDKNI